MHKEARRPSGHPSEPMRGPALMAFPLLVFPHGPCDQNTIEDLEGRIQRRLVVLPIILHPSAQDGIAHAGEIVERLLTSQVQPPAPDGLPQRFGGPGTDRWREVDKVLPPAILRPSWTKRRAQEIEALLGKRAPPVGIFARHNMCLGRMQFQMALRQPCGDPRLKPARWHCTLALRDEIIGRTLEGDGRVFPLHPGIERIRPEEIRKDRAHTTALRYPLSPLDEGTILALHGGLYPPCHIQEEPWTGRVLAECPQPQRMINVVKEPLDVQIQDPVRAPTPLPGDAEGLYC
jgi:hypothetical protein